MNPYQLNSNPKAPLIYSETQARQILNTFYPQEFQRIGNLDCSRDETRRFAQELLTTAVEASRGVSWAQSVLNAATGPSVKGAVGLLDLAKAGFEFSKNIYHDNKGIENIKDVKLYQFVIDKVANNNHSTLLLLENDIALQKQQEADKQRALFAQTTPEPKEPTLHEQLIALASQFDSKTQVFAQNIMNQDKWQRLPETLDKTDGRHAVLTAYMSTHEDFKTLSPEKQELGVQFFTQKINEVVTEREVAMAAVKVDRGMDFGRG